MIFVTVGTGKFDELIKKMLREHVPIAKYEMKEYWLDIGRIDDYERAQSVYNTHFKKA